MEFESNENVKEVEDITENEMQESKANEVKSKQRKWQLSELETLRKAYWIARQCNVPAYKVALKLLPDRTHEAIAHKFKDKKKWPNLFKNIILQNKKLEKISCLYRKKN